MKSPLDRVIFINTKFYGFIRFKTEKKKEILLEAS